MTFANSRITFLVGAGLVHEADLPMSVELVNKVKTALAETSHSAEISEEERTLAKLRLAALHFLNGAIRFQEGVLNRDPDNSIRSLYRTAKEK